MRLFNVRFLYTKNSAYAIRVSFITKHMRNLKKKKSKLACKSRVCKIPSRGFQESLYITTLITAYKRPSFFCAPQHPGRHMNVLQDLVYYMEREIRQDGRWFLEFSSWESSAVTFPRFKSAMRLKGGGDRQHARHTPGPCHGGNTARGPAPEFRPRLAYKRQPGLP